MPCVLLVPVSGAQIRFWPDARPLVERLGHDFFRTLPLEPGGYRLRDEHDGILYVGKAKSLRKRLNSYRVANPERLPRRLLRLLHLARTIDWEICADEAAALARERELLLTLRPRFNRAGVWVGPPKFLAWRLTDPGIELAVLAEPTEGWEHHGPLGSGAIRLRALLVRLLWCAFHPSRGSAGMPAGWFAGQLPDTVLLPWGSAPEPETTGRLRSLFAGGPAAFVDWMNAAITAESPAFDRMVVAEDIEALVG